jgi:hypothetical protein
MFDAAVGTDRADLTANDVLAAQASFAFGRRDDKNHRVLILD